MRDDREALGRVALAAIRAAMPGWRAIPEEDRAKLVAEMFCEMSDDGQAQTFEAIGAYTKTWPVGGQPQWLEVGKHLVECECSSDSGRQVIRDIAAGMYFELAARSEPRP